MNGYIVTILLTTGIGIINTVYLSWCCITKRDVKCLFFPPAMCVKVQHSKYSRTLGIPNPYLGLAMLLAILILTFLFTKAVVSFWLIFSIVSAGFLFSLYFLYIQTFILKAFCTWCVLSAIVFAVLFFTSLLMITEIDSIH